MSALGDLIVEGGPYDATEHPRYGQESQFFLNSDLNALRDELIELRADRAELAILRPAAHAALKPVACKLGRPAGATSTVPCDCEPWQECGQVDPDTAPNPSGGGADA